MAGPDNNVWFVETGNDSVGVLTGLTIPSKKTARTASVTKTKTKSVSDPDTGYGTPSGSNFIVQIILALATFSTAAGLLLYWRHDRKSAN